jgi:hypothetical protein
MMLYKVSKREFLVASLRLASPRLVSTCTYSRQFPSTLVKFLIRPSHVPIQLIKPVKLPGTGMATAEAG